MKHLGSLENTQEARVALTHLSCSPNFPRDSYLDERTLTHEPIVTWASQRELKFECPSLFLLLFSAFSHKSPSGP